MGCDGGTIPRRDEMVKLKKKAEKVRPNVTNLYHWPSIGHNFITPNLVKYKTFVCQDHLEYTAPENSAHK